MSVTLITSKPHLAQTIAQVIRHRFPGQTLYFPLILRRGFYRSPLPRGVGWTAYPLLDPTLAQVDRYVAPVANAQAPWEAPFLQVCAPDGTQTTLHDPALYERSIREADQVFVAVDPSPSASWAAAILQLKFGGRVPFRKVYLPDLSSSTVERAFDGAGEPAPWFDQLARQGQVKAYFDHQFLVNSLAIFGRTFATPCQPTPWVSKYQIQVLYALAEEPAQTERAILQLMQNWPGTGKYTAQARENHWDEGIGSAASRIAILSQLMAHGWLEATGDHRRALSPFGRAALAALHPGCRDLDLPFRLQRWMDEGLARAQPAMDRYLRTFFGRQKTFLAHVATPRRLHC